LLETSGPAKSQTLVHKTPTAVRRILGHGFTPMSELSTLRAPELSKLRVGDAQLRNDIVPPPIADALVANDVGSRSSSISSISSAGSQSRSLARIRTQDPSQQSDQAQTKPVLVAIKMTQDGLGLRIDQTGEVVWVSTEARDAGAVRSISMCPCLLRAVSAN
jgi:hypothetical protein